MGEGGQEGKSSSAGLKGACRRHHLVVLDDLPQRGVPQEKDALVITANLQQPPETDAIRRQREAGEQ